MLQILQHLDDNNINTNHHGSVKSRSTQTLVLELYDRLLQDLNNDQEVVLLLLDQSKAYDLVPHHILLQKLEILNYSNQNHIHNKELFARLKTVCPDRSF